MSHPAFNSTVGWTTPGRAPGAALAVDRLDLEDDVTDPLEDNLDSEERTLTERRTTSTASDRKSSWQKLVP